MVSRGLNGGEHYTSRSIEEKQVGGWGGGFAG